mmetsp:Transcript_30134/g.74778  ORF Transcript_30134/g.74778 Transcript_30134/m.74778 type:complete len:278 (-) Transcript_30134:3005-3838(-)
MDITVSSAWCSMGGSRLADMGRFTSTRSSRSLMRCALEALSTCSLAICCRCISISRDMSPPPPPPPIPPPPTLIPLIPLLMPPMPPPMPPPMLLVMDLLWAPPPRPPPPMWPTVEDFLGPMEACVASRPAARCCWRTSLISRRSSLISLMRLTFSCMMRMLSVRCSSMSLCSLRLRDSTLRSKYSRWRLYSFWMSSSICSSSTCSVTCFWYSFLTASLSCLGSWMACVVACRSWWKRWMLASRSWICLRWISTSFCSPSSLRRRSLMVRSRLALFLW